MVEVLTVVSGIGGLESDKSLAAKPGAIYIHKKVTFPTGKQNLLSLSPTPKQRLGSPGLTALDPEALKAEEHDLQVRSKSCSEVGFHH